MGIPIIISIIISMISLSISVVVAFENYLKPFKLYVFPGRSFSWISPSGKLMFDLVLTFINFGSKGGVIDNLFLEFSISKKIIKLIPVKIFKLEGNGKIIDDSYWNVFFLGARSESFKIIGLESNFNLEEIVDGDYVSKLIVFYKRKPSRKKCFSIKKDLILSINKKITLQNSTGFQRVLSQKSEQMSDLGGQ